LLVLRVRKWWKRLSWKRPITKSIKLFHEFNR
jgi:hypothetical protein